MSDKRPAETAVCEKNFKIQNESLYDYSTVDIVRLIWIVFGLIVSVSHNFWKSNTLPCDIKLSTTYTESNTFFETDKNEVSNSLLLLP